MSISPPPVVNRFANRVARPPRPALLVAALVQVAWVLSSCSGGHARVDQSPADARDNKNLPGSASLVNAHPPAQGDLVSVSEADGQVLVELPLGGEDGVEAGTFLRVYDAADAHRLKGMVQVTEVLGGKRSVARQVGLNDRQNPLRPQDHAREVADLAKLADGAAIEASARRTEATLSAIDATDQARFSTLREQYQRELAAAQARAEAQLKAANELAETRLRDSEAAQHRALELKALEARTDLAAVRTVMAEQVAAGIAADRKQQEERAATVVAEKVRLQAQVDGLLQQQQELAARIAALVKENADRERSHLAIVRAEVETRQALQARLDDLEARLAGRPASGATVLVNDPLRNETILDRLTHLSAALSAEQERVKRLETVARDGARALAEAQQANAELERRAEQLAPAAAQARQVENDLATTRQRLVETERQRAALELSRLEAERSLYDLAARVLRLAGSSPETIALQARLRDVLGAPTGDQPAQDGAAQ